MKTIFTALLVLLLATRAGAVVATCTITGLLVDATGTPIANGSVNINSLVTQVISGSTVPASNTTSKTDANGNITPVAVPQGLQVQVTVCNPKAGGCGAPIPSLIPINTTATLNDILSGIILPGGTNAVVGNLTVNSNASIGGTLGVTGASTFSGSACFADLGCWDTAGIHGTKGVGINGPVAPGSGGNTNSFTINQPGVSPQYPIIAGNNGNGGVYNQATAFSLVNPKLTSGQGLYSAFYANYCDPVATSNCTGPNDFYMAMQANGPGSTVSTPLSANLQTQAPGGMQINNLDENATTSGPLALYSAALITFGANGQTTNKLQLNEDSSGNFGIQPSNGADFVQFTGGNPAVKVVSTTNNSTDIVEIYPQNVTQGIGITWGGIQKIGSTINTNMTLNANGTGTLVLQNNSTGPVQSQQDMQVAFDHHLLVTNSGAVTPSTASCLNGTVNAGSTDNAGQVTFSGSGASGCLINFGRGFSAAPVGCVCNTATETSPGFITAQCVATTNSSQIQLTFNGTIQNNTGFTNWLCIPQG